MERTRFSLHRPRSGIGFDKRDRFVAQAISQILPFFAVRNRRIPIWVKPRLGLAISTAANINIEAEMLRVKATVHHTILGRDRARARKVPFTNEARGIAQRLQFTSVAGELKWKLVERFRIARPPLGRRTLLSRLARNVRGQTNLSRRHTSNAGSPRR